MAAMEDPNFDDAAAAGLERAAPEDKSFQARLNLKPVLLSHS